MSFVVDPLYVETVLNEKKVTQRDIEMAQWFEDSQATRVRQPRRTLGLLGWLRGFLGATSQRRPQRTG